MEILSGLQGRAPRVIELATWGKDYVTWLFPARVAKMAPTGAASVENSRNACIDLLAVGVHFVLQPLGVRPVRLVHSNLFLPLLQQLHVLLLQRHNLLRQCPFTLKRLLVMWLSPWRGRILRQLVW